MHGATEAYMNMNILLARDPTEQQERVVREVMEALADFAMPFLKEFLRLPRVQPPPRNPAPLNAEGLAGHPYQQNPYKAAAAESCGFVWHALHDLLGRPNRLDETQRLRACTVIFKIDAFNRTSFRPKVVRLHDKLRDHARALTG